MGAEHGSTAEIIEGFLRQGISDNYSGALCYVVEEIRKRMGSEENLFALAKNKGNSLEIEVDLGLGSSTPYRVGLLFIPRYDSATLTVCKVNEDGQTGDVYYLDDDPLESGMGGWSMSEGGSEVKPLNVSNKQLSELLYGALENLNASNWRFVS